MARRTIARIDVPSLRHNLQTLKDWTGPGNFFCPMVKANAYGHDAALVARVAEQQGVSALGTALVEEAVSLRQTGILGPILTFSPLDAESAAQVFRHGLTPVITRFEDLLALEKSRGAQNVAAHLKFNSGMQRLGFDAGDLPRLKSELDRLNWLRVDGVCTHLTHGEEADQAGSPSAVQIRKFLEVTQDLPGARHAHKTASLAALKGAGQESGVGARPGIGVYGLPHDGFHKGEGLRSVLTWTTKIALMHTVQKGETVSYSARWTAPRDSKVAVLPVGYGDGYMRSLSGKGQVLVRGHRVPIVGSVCMDYVMVDLTDVWAAEGEIKIGESVVVLGRQGQEEISAAEIAAAAGTIAYEVVTNISARVRREAV